jgi:hypothetical protein
MEPEDSLPLLKLPATCHYPEPNSKHISEYLGVSVS